MLVAAGLVALLVLPVYANAQLIELGRCGKVPKRTGKYSSYTCDVGGAEGRKHNFEWSPGAVDGGFASNWSPRPGHGPTPNEVAPSWELLSGRIVQCARGQGAGMHVSPFEDRETVTFGGCQLEGQACSSGTQAGDIRTAELALSYEPIGPSPINWGTIFQPAAAGPFASFSCGAADFQVDGSLVAQTPNNRTATVWRQVKINRGHGVQADQSNERDGTPFRGFVAKITEAGTSREESIALRAIYVVTNNEPLRVRISK